MVIDLPQIFQKYNISLPTSQIDLFEKFLSLFQEKNSQINLSAIRDTSGIIEKHFIDSIMLNNFIKLKGKVLDLGSGGGFPGIPLKITNPETEFVLLDSIGKKINCINYFIKELGLSGIYGICDRAEKFSNNNEFKGQFNFVIIRSVAYMPKALDWSIPFLKKGGKIILYKIFNNEEIKDSENILKKYKLKIEDIKEYKILDQERVFIIVAN